MVLYRLVYPCTVRNNHCCGSVTFLYGSGSADPYQNVTDLDLDPAPELDHALFLNGFQDVKKILFFFFFTF
jgi:hypothetical protein